MTSALVFGWLLVAGVAAVGVALLIGVVGLLRRPGSGDDVRA